MIFIDTTTMTIEKIQEMLGRFYNAETTAQEESMLKRFFQGDDVPRELQADKLLFSQLFNDRADVPHNLEARLGNDIDCWDMVEKSALRKARMTGIRRISGVAAGLLLLFTLGTYLNNRPDTARPYAGCPEETYDDPKDAAGETERALTKFSIAINKGLNKMNSTTINER